MDGRADRAIGIQLIGVYWVVRAFGDTIYNIFQIRHEHESDMGNRLVDLPAFPYAVSTFCSLAVGMLLVLRAKRFAKWLRFRA